MLSRLQSLSSVWVFLLVLTAVALATPVAAGDRFDARAASGTSQVTPDDHGTTEFVVDLAADGDATVRVHWRVPITNETDRAAFENLARAFETGDETIGAQAFVEAARAVDRTVQRPMRPSGIERNGTLVGNTTGQLTATVEWPNFARQNGTHLYIDDVLATERGLWLSGLTTAQTLTVTIPDGYGVRSAAVPVRGGELRWRGPAAFDSPAQLAVTFVGTGDPNGGSDNGTDDRPDNGTGDGPENGTGGGPGSDTGSQDSSPGGGLVWLGAGTLFLVVAAAALAVVSRRERLGEVLAGTEPTQSGETDRSEPATDGNGRQGEEKLLSDEERVRHLIADSGGRMKQAAIVEATDWSDAKVSQLTSAMEEDGQIEKLRIGRENVISLVDEDSSGES
jgi:hypothetical protein